MRLIRHQFASMVLNITSIGTRPRKGSHYPDFILDCWIIIERRLSMSAVIYLVVGLIGLLFALISLIGLQQFDND